MKKKLLPIVNSLLLFSLLSVYPQSTVFLSPLLPGHDVKPIQSLLSEKEYEEINAYINDTLSFKTLYHSEEWKEYIEHWVGFYISSSNNQDEFIQIFIPQAKKVLARTLSEDQEVALALSKDLINFFEQFGIDKAAEQFAVYASKKGLKDDRITRLVVAAGLKGKPAPAIKGVDDLSKSVVFFYESGCGSCAAEKENLKKNYSLIKSQGYKVISISTDTDEVVFKYHSAEFPWEDKICDLQGLEGVNTTNYGVISTPTFYLIGADGKVVGRYARLQDMGIIIL